MKAKKHQRRGIDKNMYTHTLATLFMLVVLGTGVFTVQLPLQSSVLYASSNESDSAENDEQATESNDDGDSSNSNDGGSTDEPETPATSTPEPEPTTPTTEPTVDDQLAAPIVNPEQPAGTTITECQEGYILKNDECVPDPLTELGNLVGPPPECPPEAGLTPLECLDKVVNPPIATEDLPPCDGSAQDCITQNGDVCLVGQGGEACECLPDMSDCPNHPSQLPPPVEEPTCPPGQFPVTPGDPSTCVDCEGECPPETPPPTEEEGPDGDCLFDPSLPKCASDNGECPEGFFQNEDANCVPDHPNGCPEGFHSHEDDETGQCIPDSVPCEPGFIIRPDFPTCERQDRVCEEFPDLDACKNGDDNDNDNDNDGDDVDVTIINKVVNIVKDVNKRGHGNFPEIDIIGLSVKENGDSNVCLLNIDKEQVQCQEFGMPDDRVNGDFWRVIETDQNKDYDNGNTGSNDIDGVIDDIKSQDFSELDDATNHDFGIDLAWIAINPSGDGVACLAEDSTGKGKSLCEPFKVSSEEIDGQITEGVAIES